MKYKNPSTNTISNDIKKQINVAISNSGYPLQIWTSKILKKHFFLLEEWAYKDRRDSSTRTIDILAEAQFWRQEKKQPRVRPILNLIVECKQSKTPFVFFLTENNFIDRDIPQIAGLNSNNITIKTDDDRSIWNFDINSILGIDKHPFISSDPKYSTVFSRMLLKGENSILSGEESYLNIVLPLVDAVNYFKECQMPPKTAVYFDLHMVFAIGVLDAPMVGVEVNKNKHKIINLPWVRMRRWDTVDKPSWWRMGETCTIDLVHKDFLDTYIEKFLLPFAKEYSKVAIKHQRILANGRGFISGMGKNSFDDLEQRLAKEN